MCIETCLKIIAKHQKYLHVFNKHRNKIKTNRDGHEHISLTNYADPNKSKQVAWFWFCDIRITGNSDGSVGATQIHNSGKRCGGESYR